ncbi:MAG: nucleotidyltransferase family protein [Candidatus Micrarchaeota archaeon]|nr:nucleotidyltransferase family protein [Candidatus Micrarchaeota archaeon]
MDAIILCGGFAKRLEPITRFIAKPLLPVGGRPLIDYIFDGLDGCGADRIIVSTNSKFADQFEYWLRIKDGKRHMMIVEPTAHNDEKFGAIRGIAYAIEKAGIDSDLMVINGDNFYSLDLKRMVERFKGSGRKPTVALYETDSMESLTKSGVVALDSEGNISEFEEKPKIPKSNLLSTGIYLYPRELLGTFKHYLSAGNHPDAPGYFIQWLIKTEKVAGLKFSGEWYDIGTMESYQELFDKKSRA